jgi:hypothetical protein
MIPDDEAHFIALWQQGLSHDARARQLGIPVGMVKSRAYTLQQRGRIQPRPRGGAYPSLRGRERSGAGEAVSAQTPRMPERVSPGVSLTPREKTERWNLYLSRDLITKTKVKAQQLGVHPSGWPHGL